MTQADFENVSDQPFDFVVWDDVLLADAPLAEALARADFATDTSGSGRSATIFGFPRVRAILFPA